MVRPLPGPPKLPAAAFTGEWRLPARFCRAALAFAWGLRVLWSKFCAGGLLDDGTHNLLGALKTSMGTLGAKDLKEMQQVEVVIAPSLLTEGKVYQKAQQLGMGK